MYAEIQEITGFDSGEEFDTASEVREYFAIESLDAMVGGVWREHPALSDMTEPELQAQLNQYADFVIENKWHCNF